MFFQLFVRFLLKLVKEHIIVKFMFIHRNIEPNNSRTKVRKACNFCLWVVQVLVMSSPRFGVFFNCFFRFLLKFVKEHIIIKFVFIQRNI